MFEKRISPIQNDLQTQNTQVAFRKSQLISTPLVIKHKNVPNQQSVSIEKVQQMLECRICLQNSHECNDRFIKPCECTGSVSYVHQICFTQWVKTTLKPKNNRQLAQTASQGMQCQICKMKFSIRISSQKACINWQKLKQKISFHKLQFFAQFFFIILTLILLIAVVALMPRDVFDFKLSLRHPESFTDSQIWVKIMFIISMFSLIIIITLIGYLLIAEFAFMYRIQFAYKGRQIKTLKGILTD